MKRPCAEPGCPVLTASTRCPSHTRERDRARGTTTERGYGAEFEKAKRRPEYMNAANCAECGCEFTIDNPKTGGHSVAIRNGGRGSAVLPHCRQCNYGWERTGL